MMECVAEAQRYGQAQSAYEAIMAHTTRADTHTHTHTHTTKADTGLVHGLLQTIT